ncbi:MAG: leucine-rich repeat protein [Porcipelethomonas sp.]
MSAKIIPVCRRQIHCDANLDDEINIRDAAFICSELVKMSGALLSSGDFNGDGQVNVYDAVAIAKYVVTALAEKTSDNKIERDNGSSESINLGNVAGIPGQYVTLPVSVACNDNFESAAFIVQWDNVALSVDEVYPAGGMSVYSDYGRGYCAIDAFGSSAVSDGEIAGIELCIPSDAKPGTEYEVHISAIDTFAEYGGEDLADTVSVSGGTITVIPSVPENIEMNEGETIEFSEHYDIFDIVSANPSVAAYKNNTLYGISAGRTELQFKMSDGTVFTSEVTVKASEKIEIQVDEEKYIFTSEYALKWTSFDNSIASVDDGVLRGVSAGTTVVYAIDTTNGKTVYTGMVTVVERSATTTVTTTSGETTKTSVSTTGTVCISEPVEIEDDYADEDMPTPSLYLSKVSGTAGETVGMNINAKCNNNLADFQLTVNWNDTDLIVSYIWSQSLNWVDAEEEGAASITAYSTSPVADGTVATIYFTIPEDAVNGTEYDIYISAVNDFSAFDGDDYIDYADTVSVYDGKITVSNEYETVSITEGESLVLTGDYAMYSDIVSDDPFVASVEDNVIYGESSGYTSITFTGEGQTFTLYVNVFTPSEFEMDVYTGKELYVSDSWHDLRWTSSDASIASVSSYYGTYGYVSAESAGTATIRAFDTETGETVYTGTVTVIGEEPYGGGALYGDYLYYKAIDEDEDGIYDYAEITGCDESAVFVEIPDEIDGLPVTSIGTAAFWNCSELEYIEIPDSITSIGDAAFLGCSGLSSLVIPGTVNSIGCDAFEGCSALENIVLPNGITSIEPWTFAGCTSLSSIIIPEGVTSIGFDAFTGCSSLTEITLPDSVTSIEPYAFYYCSALESIRIKNPECVIDEGTGYVICNGTDNDSGDPYFNGVICGYEGSTAQEYAENCGYTFALIEDGPVVTTPAVTTVTTGKTTVSSTVSSSVSGTTDKSGEATTAGTAQSDPASTTDITTDTTTDTPSGTETGEGTTTPVSDPDTTTTTAVPSSDDPGTLKGDANEDGKVNVRDAAFIAHKLAQGKSDELPECADYNGDEIINVRDAAAIAKFLASGGK